MSASKTDHPHPSPALLEKLSVREKIVIANWKMNGSAEANRLWAEEFLAKLGDLNCRTAVCAPFVYLSELVRLFKDTGVAVGAQTVSPRDQGAFTGEVSAAMAAAVGGSEAVKILLPSHRCSIRLAVGEPQPFQVYLDEAVKLLDKELQRLEEKLRFSYPYPADTVTPRRMAVSELAERAAREHYLLKRRPKCLTRQEATAAERGNAAHRAMQFADLAALKKDPKAEIERLVAEGYLYREDGALIDTRVLEKLMSSPLGERMRKADRVEREMRFLQEFTPEELAAIDPALRVPGTTLIMGAVDAVLVEGDHAVLLDYKTDRVAAPQELTGRYALQLKLYAAMVRRQFGLPVTEAVLYSFCLGQAVKVEL